MNDINPPEQSRRRATPTTPVERVVTLALFFITVIIITWMLVN